MSDQNPGLALRRRLVGSEYVDLAMARSDAFNKPFQDYLNTHVWEAVWNREGLPLKLRSLVVVTCLIALDRPRELALHARAAVKNGWTVEEIREVVMQTAVYCGAPAAVEAMRVLNECLAEEIAKTSS
jgi:4-carboxymuconolactone decarboxylase